VGFALGFDLGTTFTAAAVVRDGRAEMVSLGNHAVAVPSIVFLREDGELLVGEAAERRSGREPTRAARAFKRRFGDSAPIILDRTPFSADRLSMALLSSVMEEITRRQGEAPAAVAVTHPANWGGYKLDLLRQALTTAGLGAAQFVPEPVAAAVQYASTTRVDAGQVVAVYDLGGGTFDACVLQKTADGFAVLGQPQGIERLGGIDFDEAVLAHVRASLGGAMTAGDLNDPAVREALAAVRDECVRAKEALSADSEVTIPVALPHLRTSVRLTRAEFEDMVRPMVRETVAALRRAVESAKVPLEHVGAVLLAGGSSRIPLVAELVQRELGRPVVSDSHPKHTVALGAARVAARAVAPAPVAPPAPAPVAPAAPLAPPPGVPSAPAAATAVPHAKGRRPALVYAGAAAAAVALVLLAVVVLGGDDEGGGTAAATTQVAGATTLPAAGTSEGTTTGPAPTATGANWSAAVLPGLVADLDAALPGEPTEFASIGVYQASATAAVPSATPGGFERYEWAGSVTGPTPTQDFDAGTPTFVISDIDWTAVGAQTAAAPSILGMPNGEVILVVAQFVNEQLVVSVHVSEGQSNMYVLLDSEGVVVATGP